MVGRHSLTSKHNHLRFRHMVLHRLLSLLSQPKTIHRSSSVLSHPLAGSSEPHEAFPPNLPLAVHHVPPKQRQVQQQRLPAARPSSSKAVPPALLPLALPLAVEWRWLQLGLRQQGLQRQQCSGVGCACGCGLQVVEEAQQHGQKLGCAAKRNRRCRERARDNYYADVNGHYLLKIEMC